MDYEINFYYIDNDRNDKCYTIEAAEERAKELAKELKYYPTIRADITIII